MVRSLFQRVINRLKSPQKTIPQNYRSLFINSIPKSGEVLELGPFYNPICKGSQVKYFDILSQEDLKERAKAENITNSDRINKIPFIDYVSPTGDLRIINAKFDAVVSSHVIEHQLDFINHLQTVSNLLKDTGKYFLIIPDKRYCFDHFNNESTIAGIINNHVEKREKHSLKSVIEHRAFTTHNNAGRHWAGDHGTIEGNNQKVKDAITEYNTGAYIDVHAWYFTPDSFSHIIKSLHELGYIDLKIRELYPTPYGSLEFYVVLERV